MIKHEIVAVSVAANTAGLANDVAPASGVALTLAANNAADSLAHLIVITNNSATDYSTGGKTLAVVGTGPNGEAQTETITGPGASTTTTTTKHFLSAASVTPNYTRGAADTVDVGWTAESVSATKNPKLSTVPQFNIGFGCSVESGTPTYTVQQTYDGVTWYNHATVSAETTSQEGVYTNPVAGIRLKFTAAGGVTLTSYQVEG